MTYKDIEKTLKKEKPYLEEKFFIKKIGIFGSYAREEESAKSDIDILIELKKPIGWEFIDLKEYLEKVLGKKVDLVTIKALKPQLKPRILNEVKYA